MVGAEYHAHVVGILPFAHLVRQPRRFRGGGVLQFVDQHQEFVGFRLALLADFAIGANGVAVQWRGGLLGPFGERLGQQVQGGHEEQDAPAPAGEFFGKA